ncbi:crosslink repair DNA glycosylase YcaQ family protein [Solimonas sp. SE-A11]|uniref:DNA glycosylase AlkZ-like family protein n=1 Tax=Solimonas sp. SE-A11 TaxID=3054954 RepID=UPI00259CB918|nr:crosslink repair DNA glycosylase YcaQ family protein [Solimonas sp. SE-A11]MDM4769926.1 crosslink repair DNA glycosylase YcaQ family protein [Solimonas sp. SE-A11]
MPRALQLDDLRRYAIARSLFAPTTLPRAIERLGFVQADPLRAPARAQDLTLRHRVSGYAAGELERRYPRLAIEEDFFVNYGFLPRRHLALMHPRTPRTVWDAARWKQAHEVLAFVQERGAVHPREVDAQFAHGKTRNWFGGSSNASTQLLDGMHYRGLLRVARRDAGVRVYTVAHGHEAPDDADVHARMDELLDLVIAKYAPLPAASLAQLASLLAGGVPQWRGERAAALARAKRRAARDRVGGVDWYWPSGENPASSRHGPLERVYLLAPFDPVAWDRRRFEQFWGWAYRFEAYTPAPKRRYGHYALPLLWRDEVIGWANAAVQAGRLQLECGYISGRAPREAAFRRALEEERSRMAGFLSVAD